MHGAPPPAVPVPFWYNAEILEWHDGDTVLCRVDRGVRDYSMWSIRLAGCALRELDDPGGPEALEEVNRRLPPGSKVVLSTLKPDKYGDRKDARIWHRGADGRLTELSGDLIADGWAAFWTGRGAQPKPPWPRAVG